MVEVRRHISGCDRKNCGYFECDVCDEPTPNCMGGSDDMPDSCDHCWAAEHEDDEGDDDA